MIGVLLIHAGSTAVRSRVRALLTGQRDVTVAGEAGTVARARTLLGAPNYDVALLDLQLEGGDAFELLPHVRRGARVVMMTAPDPAITQALDSGAVDYLVKPVEAEPLARILAKLRVASGSNAPFPETALVPVRSGSVVRLLRVDDVRLIVSRENYTEVAVAGGERVLVRRTMQQWEGALPPRQFARVHRSLLLNLACVARVERADAATKLHLAGGTQPPIEVKRRHWPALRARLEAWRTHARAPAAQGRDEKSIAVLPFANLSADPANAPFCDGVSEELLNVLSKIPALRVAARTSAFYFRGSTAPVTEVARQLGVDYVVEGSVRRGGVRVRITAQLIRGADGFHVWSENFDRELADILAVQDEIAAEIAANLQLKLGAAERAPVTVNARAHWLALEGRHFWNLRTSDGFRRAEAAFGQALALDPRYAAAHSGLADVCNVRALYRLADGERDVADDLTRAREGARRALQLDPTLAEPHATIGFVAFHEGRLAEAQREFPKALALNPNYATGYQFYAWILCAQGKLDCALAEYARSIELDPLSFINIDRYAAMLLLAGRLVDALAANERAASLRPDVFVGNLSQRAPILLGLGRRDDAVAVARRVRGFARDLPFRRNSDADAIFVLREAGKLDEASAYAVEVLESLPEGNYLRGFVRSALGEHDAAWRDLEHTPTIMLPQLYFSPMWDAVRSTAVFRKLIANLGRTAEYERARETVRRMGKHDGALG